MAVSATFETQIFNDSIDHLMDSLEAQPELEQAFEQLEQQPLVIAVPEMAEDELARARANRFIGACALGGEVEFSVPSPEVLSSIESLYDAIQLAAEGSVMARKMVETNVRTDVIERTMKTGHVISVELDVDEAGKIQQFGQSMESVQANSLRMAADTWQMKERTEIEATNAFRIQELHEQGTLQDYSFVVFSPAADNMTEKEMNEVGFFTETMSCAIQVTSAEGDVLITESAFVAGIRSSEEDRHDTWAITGVADELGVDVTGKTASEILGTPILVHNSMLKNGVSDIVEMYDDCAGGTFFGEDKPKQDYKEYLTVCYEREERFQPKVDTIVDQLIKEAPRITDRVAATERLATLSEKAMVDQAIGDTDINPLVFGEVSAGHIRESQMHIAAGNYEQANAARSRAQETAASSSCPGAAKSSAESTGGDTSKDADNDDCEFVSKECPKCREKNVKTKISKGKITGACGCSASMG